jgi:hypothetical protein
MARIPTAAVASGSLVAGYLVARETHVRPLGGVVLAAAGTWCMRAWKERAGGGRSAALLGVYVAGFGLSHPLAKRIGPWPAVLGAAAASGGASWLLADRGAPRSGEGAAAG